MGDLDRVILLVNDMTIKGNTRVQKYAFLASQLYSKELAPLNFYDDWKSYFYGPHSAQLSHDLRLAVKGDLIDENVKETANGRKMHVYSLKIKGRTALRRLLEDHNEMIKILYEKFTQLNKQSMMVILKDIYEAYPKFTVNSEIKEDVLNSANQFEYEDNLESKRLSPDIEHRLELIQSGNVKGRRYTPSEYLHHIDQILED